MTNGRHQLEGKYIVYEYGIYDGEYEDWALALYRLRGEDMKEVYHPSDHARRPGAIGEEQKGQLIKLIKRKGINKVYSVNHHRDFFGIPPRCVEIPTDEGVEMQWEEWVPVREGSHSHRELEGEGIEVAFREEMDW
mgnify:CR=1 FL=1